MVISDALIIKKSPYREYDHALELLTPDRGKITVAARGTRRSSSKLNPHLVYLNTLVVGVVDGPKNKVLVHVDTKRRFLGSEYGSYEAAFDVIKLVDERVWADLPEPFTFELVCDTLARIECSPRDAQKILFIFKTQFLKALGYLPQFTSCVSCSKYIAMRKTFSYTHGGLLCESCHYVNDMIEVKDDAFWGFLDRVSTQGFDTLYRWHGTAEAALCNFMDKLINYFTHRRLGGL